jgi:hypothetical protein
MTAPKIETAESAAKKIAESLQPVVTLSGFDRLKQPEAPTVKPLPSDLARALGQTKR